MPPISSRKTLGFYCLGLVAGISPVAQADVDNAPADADNAPLIQLEEITVTARRRQESLQSIPDAVTAFTAKKIENAGISQVGDFMAQVPNLTFRNGAAFRKGDIRISMRGIGNGQEGWAPVTFIVDGVPTGSLEAINAGTLDDIERIEVLRGPQSALYGAGAIAGAVNVITQAPSNELEFKAKAAYAKGDDKSISTMASGPLVEDKLLLKVRANYRNADGLIDSASNGIDLDYAEQTKLSGRLIFMPQDNLEFDLRAEYIREENGSTYQEKFADPALIDTFNSALEPRRGFPGEDDRKIYNLALKMEWNLDAVSLISVSGYSKVDQEVNSSLCWDDPDDPAVDGDPVTPGIQVGCLFGTSLGSAANPGEITDQLFNSVDNFETFTQDIRFVSPEDQDFRWLFGGSILKRTTLTGFDGSLLLAPDNTVVTLFPSWHAKKDFWWGIYGQASLDLTEQLELTVAARYDDNEYKDTQYTDRTKAAVIPVPDVDGVLVSTQVENKDSFQPKVQLSYDFSDDLMVYATWSKGFRAGSFNTGSFTLPERTTNYEIGLKSTLFDNRLMLNATVFHIDYSDQQFSTVIATPPFRFPITIPETNINGMELETVVAVSDSLSVNMGVGYLDSELANDGGRSPIAPKWTVNAGVDFVYPVTDDWSFRFHGDYRHTSSMYLGQNETSRIKSKDFMNLRAGVENDNWSVTAFMTNVLDTRQAEMELGFLAGGYIRAQNLPRSYGLELKYVY